jgi:hypothetical protein
MFFSYFTLFVALSLSAIAAWYSIVGLTAIFAAAVVPIIIMGGALEVAKITATVWLHEHWNRCRFLMKVYLVSAVILLMIITSMGIFGFLSRAHIEQGAPIGDSQAQIQILDEKIAIEQEVIEQYRRDLAILNQQIERFNELGAVSRGVNVRAAQQQERQEIFAKIEKSQTTITELRQQRAPLAADIRKIETEVGPIKYIAALIYGDEADQNLLEKAVRWVIILLVVVFDPLAVMLVLAATESLKWRREQAATETVETDPSYPPDDGPPTDEQVEQIQQSAEKSILEQHPYLSKPFVHFENLEPIVAPTDSPEFLDDNALFEETRLDELDDISENETPQVKAAMRRWKESNPGETVKHQRELYEQGRINQLPWESLIDATPSEVTYGDLFPEKPKKGDLHVRTDYVPSKLYKFVGTRWIEIDKHSTDSYTYNTAYIDHLIEKISAGEYEPDMLTDSEQEQISLRLQTKGQ